MRRSFLSLPDRHTKGSPTSLAHRHSPPRTTDLCSPIPHLPFCFANHSFNSLRSANGTTTNGTASSAACRFTLPGYGSNSADDGAPTSAYACQAETFAATVQGPVPTLCSNCTAGLSTNGAQGATACGYAQAGYFAPNGTAASVAACAVDTFSPSPVLLNGTGYNCTACADGTSTFNATAATACANVTTG